MEGMGDAGGGGGLQLQPSPSLGAGGQQERWQRLCAFGPAAFLWCVGRGGSPGERARRRLRCAAQVEPLIIEIMSHGNESAIGCVWRLAEIAKKSLAAASLRAGKGQRERQPERSEHRPRLPTCEPPAPGPLPARSLRPRFQTQEPFSCLPWQV